MIITAVLSMGELYKPHNKKSKIGPLFFFIIPLILAFVLPAHSLDSSANNVGDIQLSGSDTISEKTVSYASSDTSSNLSTYVIPELSPEEEKKTDDTYSAKNNDASAEITSDNGIALQDGVLVMDGSNFYDCVNEIYADLDRFNGMSIEVIGFVYNDSEDFSENEFVPARLMMVCCAADMVPVGLLCRYQNACELETDSWVKVSGIIGQTDFNGDIVPYIEAVSVEKSEKPSDEYIYPY